MANRVYSKVRTWFHGYEHGTPHKRRGVVPIGGTIEDMVTTQEGYTHKILFKLNELRFLEEVLDYVTQSLPDNDPKRVVYIVIKKAREQHEKLQDIKRIAISVEYAQPYLFDKSHVYWMFTILGLHSMGRLNSDVDLKKAAEEIKKADW
jgi:hypothetical protein